MALARRAHWQTCIMPVFLAAYRNVGFEWGKTDCCLIAADMVLALTGTDIADDFRGKYTDRASAFELIKSVCGGSTVADAAAYCAAKYGLIEREHVLTAQRGDLVVIQDGEDLIAGFVHPNGRHAMSIGTAGLKYLPLSQVTKAWKV